MSERTFSFPDREVIDILITHLVRSGELKPADLSASMSAARSKNRKGFDLTLKIENLAQAETEPKQ